MAETSSQGQSSGGALQTYLDKAMSVLERFGITSNDQMPHELTNLLDEVKHVDEAKVLAIAKTIKHMGTFNQMVRDNVEDIKIGNRYIEITQMFDSIREDSKTLIGQLDDGKISLSERLQNLWMKIRRGSPQSRFEDIVNVYKDVCRDTQVQLRLSLWR